MSEGEPKLTSDETDALTKKLLERDPKTGEEHLKVLQEFEQNAKSSQEGFPEGSAQSEEAARVAGVLSLVIRQQMEVNTTLVGLDPKFGSVFCIPGQGILCTGVLAQLFGQKPLPTLAAFNQRYGELKQQIQEQATKLLTEAAVEAKQEIAALGEKIQWVINREKGVIDGAVTDRKGSGWFGSLSRGLTLSDPYQIEINGARQKVSTMQDVCQPLLKEAETALSAKPPNVPLARQRMQAVERIRGNTNKVDTDTSHFEQEQAALTVTQNVSIAVIVSAATLGVGGASMGGGKLAWEGTKLAYHGLSTGLTYLTVGTAVAGATSSIARDLTGERTRTDTPEDSEKTNEIAKMAQMPAAERLELLGTKMLELIPNTEECTYSPELLTVAMEKAAETGLMFAAYTDEPDPKEREALLGRIIASIESGTADLMQQFLKDNVDPTTSKRFGEAREDREKNDTLRVGKIVGQINMLEPLSRGDRAGALEAARSYIKSDVIGIQEQDVPPASTMKILDGMAQSLLAVTETQTYPLLVQGIQAYSKTGFSKSFTDKLGGIAHFVGDVVSAPFSEESSGRLGKGYNAISTIVSQGKADDVAMGVIKFAKTACNVAIDNVQALDLLETLGGSMALDALIILGTAGAGKALQSAEDAGKVTAETAKGIRVAGTVAGVVNTGFGHVQKPYSYAAPVTLSGLNKTLSDKVVKKDKKSETPPA